MNHPNDFSEALHSTMLPVRVKTMQCFDETLCPRKIRSCGPHRPELASMGQHAFAPLVSGVA